MKCKEYVFKLTSGQLDEAPVDERLQAKLHWMVCKYCRAFTRNNDKLNDVLAGFREHVAKKTDSDAQNAPGAQGDA